MKRSTDDSFVFWLILFAAALVVVLAGCGGDRSITGPVPQGAEQSAPANSAATTWAVNAAPVPEDEAKIVSISPDGVVTITKERTWTACVYTYKDFQLQSLSHSYTVKGPGTTPFKPGPICGAAEVQLDVQAGPVCPADPWAGPFDGFRAGRAGIKVFNDACPVPQPTPTPQPTPSPEPTPTPTPSPTPTPPPPLPAVDYCYYEPDCGVRGRGNNNSSCDHEALCLALPAELQPVWGNWFGQTNHCRTVLPGVAKDNFQLTPGKSHKDCLRKQDS